MAQISRPFQIALAAVALLALVWVVALHRPGGGSSSSEHAAPTATKASGGSSSSSSSSSSSGGSSSAGSSVYHGSAPGVEGLTKAIAKAHGAVATSQQNAKQLEAKAAQASSNEGAPASRAGTPAATPRSTAAPRSAATQRSAAPSTTHAASRAAAPTHARAPRHPATGFPRQRAVEAQLAHGKIVAVLFWSPKGSDDVAVRDALRALAGHDRGLALQLAAAGQVASFGTITRGIQVDGTPTVLLVGAHGRTRVLTGLQDGYAIEQAVSQLRHP